MSQCSIHLVTNQIPGCALSDGKCQASARSSLLSSSSNQGHITFGGANALLKPFPLYHPRAMAVRCKASDNHRRNFDFPRQQRGSFRGRNRQYPGRDSDSDEETDLLPSKNGSLLSLPSNQRYSATAIPGQREKEIVALFRKVQAQLRERAAIKEEKKIEASQQGQGQGERGTVDSLLKLLRQHSAAQGKKSGQDEELNLDQPEKYNSFEEEPNSKAFSGNITIDKVEPDTVPSKRPTSNFRRRSPVPQVKFEPVFLGDEANSSGSTVKPNGEIIESSNEPEPELVALEEPGEESSDELSDSSDTDETAVETLEPSAPEIADLTLLKLSELRDIAKSRGVKGYSKLKKAELVGLLCEDCYQ